MIVLRSNSYPVWPGLHAALGLLAMVSLGLWTGCTKEAPNSVKRAAPSASVHEAADKEPNTVPPAEDVDPARAPNPPPAGQTVEPAQPAQSADSADSAEPAEPAEPAELALLPATVSATEVPALIRPLVGCAWKAPSEVCKAAAKRLLEVSRSQDANVRLASLRWLTLPVAVRVDGVVPRLLSMVNRDPNQRVRRAACSKFGRMRHPRLLASAARYTISAHEPGLYSACFEALVGFWAEAHNPYPPSEDAYRLTLKRLQATPRKAHQPPVAVLNLLRRLPIHGPKNTTAQAAWMRASRPFYRSADLAAAVISVLLDSAVPWQTRLASIEVLVHMRVPLSRLESLAKVLEQQYTERDRTSKNKGPRPVLMRLRAAMKAAL